MKICCLIAANDQRHQVFLRGLFRQRMLDGVEAALLGHAALRADISVACRVVTDDDDGRPGLRWPELSSVVAAEVTASMTEAAAAFPSMTTVMDHPMRWEA